MPEGDTVHRVAARLAPGLVGQRVARIDAPRARRIRAGAPPPGTRVDAVHARGKHLLIEFGDGTVLRTHLRMTGSWHTYAAGDRWRKSAHLARVVLELENGAVAVCFSAPEVEWLRDRRAADERLAHLGPDLTVAAADVDGALARLAALDPRTEVADALLDQRVACGVGNVFKSEVCFACGVDPFASIGELDATTRRSLLETAARLLSANAPRARRVTYAGGLAVYGRSGRPCPRCRTRIRVRRQGPHQRATYWCPRCQPSGVGRVRADPEP